jgi:hypothetical protein
MGRVVAEGEPLWLDEDRAWALALLEVEADSCPECHQPWVKPPTQERVRLHRPPRPLPRLRHVREDGTGPPGQEQGRPDGLHVHVERDKTGVNRGHPYRHRPAARGHQQYTRGMRQAADSTSRLAGAGAAVGTAMVTGFAIAAASAAKFDKALSNVRAVTGRHRRR